MDGLNRVTLLGNVSRDPELRHTTNSSVLRLGMATNGSYVDAKKERHKTVEYHNINVWGKRAEALAKLMSKGDRVYVEGRLATRSWEAEDGTKRYATEITATDIILLGNKKSRESDPESFHRGDAHEPECPSTSIDDDFPF